MLRGGKKNHNFIGKGKRCRKKSPTPERRWYMKIEFPEQNENQQEPINCLYLSWTKEIYLLYQEWNWHWTRLKNFQPFPFSFNFLNSQTESEDFQIGLRPTDPSPPFSCTSLIKLTENQNYTKEGTQNSTCSLISLILSTINNKVRENLWRLSKVHQISRH